MNISCRIACFVVLTVVVTGTSFAQRTSSAQQSVTFGVVRAPQFNVATIAATANMANSQIVSYNQDLQRASGETITKITFSPKTPANSPQNISRPADGLSVMDSGPRATKSGDFGQSALLTSEPLVVTITD